MICTRKLCEAADADSYCGAACCEFKLYGCGCDGIEPPCCDVTVAVTAPAAGAPFGIGLPYVRRRSAVVAIAKRNTVACQDIDCAGNA